jgi:hypothetical protein
MMIHGGSDMKSLSRSTYRFVQRHRAEEYLLTTLVCFGLTVALTRLFLELTGYPQIGNSEIHIAHVLWGGLFLFASVVVLLVWQNNRVYPLGAVLGGIGMGLFIDEVGKFITQSNNYFTPWAAPIVYAFFLLTVLIYVRVNQRRPTDPRAEMYHALDLLTEVLDHDLEPDEHAQLLEHLQFVAQNSEEQSDQKQLAKVLLAYSQGSDLHLAPETPDFWQWTNQRFQRLDRRWGSRELTRWICIAAVAALATLSIVGLVVVASARWAPGEFSESIARLIAAGPISHLHGVQMFSAYMALNGAIGLLLVSAAVIWASGKENIGTNLAYFGLLLDLTVSNLLAFYFEQFSTIFLALVQLGALMAVLHYRRKYLYTKKDLL